MFPLSRKRPIAALLIGCSMLVLGAEAVGQRPGRGRREPQVSYPPVLDGGKAVVTDRSSDFLKPPESLRADVRIAQTPPTIDFLYYPGQTYPGKPWSNWGDGLATDGKYYSAIGDHLAIGVKGDGSHGTGNAFLYEYDAREKTFRQLVDVARTLQQPEGHYTPGKIHSRLDMGRDGWLYFSTHRGSARSAVDQYHYRGDWILRCDPRPGGAVEVVARGPVPKHSIPTSVLDPDRLIFYGGTAAGPDAELQETQFFAFDVKNRRLLYSGPDGPARYLMFARSTGRVYYVPGREDGPLMRYDPETGQPPVKIGGRIGLRAATQETPQGYIYTVSLGQRSSDAAVWSFNTRTEEIRQIGTAAVGTQAYVASIDADPSGRYVYYVPGAHGGGHRDGSPVVQMDTATGEKKVLAFLHPFYQQKYGCTPKGTYSTAVSPGGDKLYITWNTSRGTRAWDCCALTVVHIPESER